MGGRCTRNPAVLWRSTSRGPVVLAPDRDAPERLSGTAAVIWELLDEPLDPDELGDGVALVVGRPADVATSLDLLVEARLVASRPDG